MTTKAHTGSDEIRELVSLGEDTASSFTQKILASYGYLIAGVLSSHIVGLLGLPFDVVVLLSLFVGVMYLQFRRPMLRQATSHVRSKILQKKIQMHEEFHEAESVEWINTLVDRIWMRLGPQLQETLQQQIDTQLEAFKNSIPSFVREVAVVRFDMGTICPEISSVKFESKSKEVYKLGLAFHYIGDLNIVVEGTFGFKWVTIKVPISVDNVELTTQATVKLDLGSSPPFVHTVSISISECEIDLSVKPFHVLDIMNLPILSQFIKDTVVRALRLNPIVVDLVDKSTKEEIARLKESKSQERMKRGRTVTNLFAALAKKPVPEKTMPKVEDQVGVLSVKFVEARNLLPLDFGFTGGTSDPFCSAFVGETMLKTQVMKKTLHPQWNELLQFQVAKDTEKKLTVKVMNWNQFTDSEFMGLCYVDFSQMADNEKLEQWYPLCDKQGNPVADRGEIRLEVSYYAE